MKTIRFCLLIVFICGIIYPLATTGIAQLIFPKQANGSLILNKDHKVVGSELIGQSFTSLKYFHGRISSIDNDAAASGSNNYAPSNKEMLKRVDDSIDALKRENPKLNVNKIPLDLITNSGSGLDPDISIQAAEFQIPRIVKETGISEQKLRQLIKNNTADRSLGIFGEQRVNVLQLNLDVEEIAR